MLEMFVFTGLASKGRGGFMRCFWLYRVEYSSYLQFFGKEKGGGGGGGD